MFISEINTEQEQIWNKFIGYPSPPPPLWAILRYFFVILQFFNTSSAENRSTSLFTKISLDIYLASKQIVYPVEIFTQPQVVQQTQVEQVFYPKIRCLGRCDHCKRKMPCQNKSRLYNDLCMFAHAAPASFTRTKL